MVCRDVVANIFNPIAVVTRKFAQKISLKMSKKRVTKKNELKAEIEGRKSLLLLQKSAFQKIMDDMNGKSITEVEKTTIKTVETN